MSKKDDIKQAFTDLIIKEGIRNLNMNDVFKTANVGSGTFYNYYKSKEDLIKELFFEYWGYGLDETKVEIPKGIEITDVKPIIMEYLDKTISMMSTSNKVVQVLSILGPEFNRRKKDLSNKSLVELHTKIDNLLTDKLSWLSDLLLKGQQLGQIIKLDPNILMTMMDGAFTKLLIPRMNSQDKKQVPNTKVWTNFELSKNQWGQVKEAIWNMISVH